MKTDCEMGIISNIIQDKRGSRQTDCLYTLLDQNADGANEDYIIPIQRRGSHIISFAVSVFQSIFS